MPNWACETCHFELFFPVETGAALSASHLGLYADAKFPGRAILAYTSHAEHLEDLSEDDLWHFWRDAARVGRALRTTVGAARINYAVLGNADRHLHIHIVPRQPNIEPLPSRSPWSDPRPSEELSSTEYSRLSGQLSRVLSGARE